MTGPGCSNQTAILFYSHRIESSVLGRFEKLSNEALSSDDVYFLYDATDAADEDIQSVQAVAGDRLRTFEEPNVMSVDYPNPWADPARQELVPGNTDLLFLHFARIEPDYSRYWFIEYDVAYTGNWSEFFKTFRQSKADLIGTTLRSYAHQPDWYWWPSLEPAPDLDRSEWLRGFFPVIRLSDKLLELVAEAYSAGWSGHQEAVLPTVARYHGRKIEDIGGDGPYVRDENINRFYTNSRHAENLSPGTFVYRPARSHPGNQSGMLWHPVKPNQG
jgi:hypothetical protein